MDRSPPRDDRLSPPHSMQTAGPGHGPAAFAFLQRDNKGIQQLCSYIRIRPSFQPSLITITPPRSTAPTSHALLCSRSSAPGMRGLSTMTGSEIVSLTKHRGGQHDGRRYQPSARRFHTPDDTSPGAIPSGRLLVANAPRGCPPAC